MGFVTEVRLAHPDLLLAPTLEAYPDATIRYEYETVTDDAELCFVTVFDADYPRLEETLATDHTVSDPTRIATFADRAVYRLTVDTPVEVVPNRCAERGLFVFEVTTDGRWWVPRMHVPDRDVLASFREYARDHGISFRMNKLYELTPTDDRSYFLTEQQHEILLLAYYAGYYDIPRAVSQDYLADRLGISGSAVSQRLRRAVAELIAATLENDRMPGEFE